SELIAICPVVATVGAVLAGLEVVGSALGDPRSHEGVDQVPVRGQVVLEPVHDQVAPVFLELRADVDLCLDGGEVTRQAYECHPVFLLRYEPTEDHLVVARLDRVLASGVDRMGHSPLLSASARRGAVRPRIPRTLARSAGAVLVPEFTLSFMALTRPIHT